MILKYIKLSAAFLTKPGGTLFEADTWSCKSAFTLAEILITFGVIGIVAAMTLPALIQRNNNKITEARLKKFYSSINQAVTLAEAEYGDKEYWFVNYTTAEEVEKWFMTYLGKNLQILRTDYNNKGFIMYFSVGSALKQMHGGTSRDWLFYPQKADKCIEKYGFLTSTQSDSLGVCAFAFIFNPKVGMKYHEKKGFEPWKYGWDGNRDTLLNGCKSSNRYFCTALIQMNNWEIPKDYPHKVSY